MHTVVETPYFTTAAKRENVSDEEIAEIVATIARHPAQGDLIRGTGGARKRI